MAVSSDLTPGVRWCGCPINAYHTTDCPVGKAMARQAYPDEVLADEPLVDWQMVPPESPLVWEGDQA